MARRPPAEKVVVAESEDTAGDDKGFVRVSVDVPHWMADELIEHSLRWGTGRSTFGKMIWADWLDKNRHLIRAPLAPDESVTRK